MSTPTIPENRVPDRPTRGHTTARRVAAAAKRQKSARPALPAVYLDFHGIQCDFLAGVSREFEAAIPQGPQHVADFLGCSHPQFWHRLNTAAFWATLPELPPGRNLHNDLLAFCAPRQLPLYLLTRPQEFCPRAYEGTIQLAQRMGWRFEQIVFAHDKASCAPGFLIDDEPANLQRWTSRGGQGFLWPSHWNHWTGLPEASLRGWVRVRGRVLDSLASYLENP